MKTESYYRISDSNRLSKLQKMADRSMDNELVKLFKGKESEYLSILIENILKSNDLENIRELINSCEVSVKERDLDLLRVLYSGKRTDYESLNEYWRKEVKFIGNSILKKIPFKTVIDYFEKNIINEDYEFHLKLIQELDIRY